jgi:hypothetical protein
LTLIDPSQLSDRTPKGPANCLAKTIGQGPEDFKKDPGGHRDFFENVLGAAGKFSKMFRSGLTHF